MIIDCINIEYCRFPLFAIVLLYIITRGEGRKYLLQVDDEGRHGGRRGRITMNKHHGGDHGGRFIGGGYGGRKIKINKSLGRKHGGGKGREFGSDYSDYLSPYLQKQLKKEGIESKKIISNIII